MENAACNSSGVTPCLRTYSTTRRTENRVPAIRGLPPDTVGSLVKDSRHYKRSSANDRSITEVVRTVNHLNDAVSMFRAGVALKKPGSVRRAPH